MCLHLLCTKMWYLFTDSFNLQPICNQSISIYLSIFIGNRYQSIATRIFAIDWSSINWYRLVLIDINCHRLSISSIGHPGVQFIDIYFSKEHFSLMLILWQLKFCGQDTTGVNWSVFLVDRFSCPVDVLWRNNKKVLFTALGVTKSLGSYRNSWKRSILRHKTRNRGVFLELL